MMPLPACEERLPLSDIRVAAEEILQMGDALAALDDMIDSLQNWQRLPTFRRVYRFAQFLGHGDQSLDLEASYQERYIDGPARLFPWDVRYD